MINSCVNNVSGWIARAKNGYKIRSGDKNDSGSLEWSYGLRSAKLCALWTAQAFICSKSLAHLLRRAQSQRKIVFCADFDHLVFFVGIHILFAKKIDC
jgi:hypothetical protein